MAVYTGYISVFVPLATEDADAVVLGQNAVKRVYMGDELEWVDMDSTVIQVEDTRKVVSLPATLDAIFKWQKHDGPLSDLVYSNDTPAE
jgi:hypothetical protein